MDAAEVVRFEAVDVVFGRAQARALEMLDAGAGRDAIRAETGAVLGVAAADLAVEEGQICVLMGLSGSGKSSLLRCVNGLNTVSRGRLLVRDGERQVDVASCDAATLRQLRMNRISMVFQQFGLLPWRSVRDNVGFGLELRGMVRQDIARIVDEKLALVHLEGWADKSVAELSGGMQQRVGLARAFATDGDILLMDEPFSALDPLIRHHLQDELLALQRRLRKTIVFVSHDLDEAVKLGNRIVIMDAGRIVQQGSAEDIVFDPVSDYVRAFVASMNPLQVLRAETLMRPLQTFTRSGDVVELEAGLRVQLDAADRPRLLRIGEREADLRPLADLDEATDRLALSEAVLCAEPDSPMRALVTARRRTAHPVLVMSDGRLLGTVGEHEIYDGLLRQGSHESASAEPR